MDQCVLLTMTHGCLTWSRYKQLANKQRTAQRATEKKNIYIKLQNKVPCSEIWKRTKTADIVECILKQKCRKKNVKYKATK